MKNTILSLIAISVAVGALVYTHVTRPPKIAYAETAVLMSQFSEAIKARKQFEESKKEWDKNLKLINDSLMASMNVMKQSYEKSSKKEREKMRKDLNKWNDDLNRYTNAVKKMSQDKEKELMEPVINKINSYLKIWGERQGYALILGTMTGGNILQADARYNLTTEILSDLNEHYKDLPKAEEPKVSKKPQKKTISVPPPAKVAPKGPETKSARNKVKSEAN